MRKYKLLEGKKKAIFLIIALVIIFSFVITNAIAVTNPGEVTVGKTATANGDGTYDVSINVTGAPFTTGTEAGRYDVVLVVDRSTSMNTEMPGDTPGTRLDSAKSAAIGFVNVILGDNANVNNRVAFVSFGTDGQQVQGFTGKSSKQTLIDSINGLSASGTQYTNIQEGLIYARDYIDNDANASANKIVILLSDGEPTRSVSDLYWTNNSSGSGRYLDETQMADSWYPSSYSNDGTGTTVEDRYIDRIIVEANKIRALGADIYSIGIDASATMAKALGNDASYHFSRNSGTAAWQTGSGGSTKTWSIPYPYTARATSGSTTGDYLIPGFSDFKVAYAKAYYTTNNSDELDDIFQGLIEDFSTVATGGILTDRLPEYFDLVLSSLPVGASYDAATRTITWNVGSIGDTKNLTYKVTPVAGYYGNGYTNASTSLTATAVAENPFYTPSKSISINVLSPTRYDQGVIAYKYAGVNDTVNNVNRNSSANITVPTVMGNDTITSIKYVSYTNNGGTLVDGVYIKNVGSQPYLSSGASYGTVVQNPDGSFTYTYNLATYGYDKTKTSDSFYYYLADSSNTASTRSNPIKVTINLVDLVDVTAQYLNNVGGAPIVGDQTLVRQIGDSVVYADVERDLLASNGFIYNHGVPELSGGATYTVVSGSNVLKLYYDNATGRTVNVYFKDKADDSNIATMQTLSGTYGDSYTIPQPTIAGYTYDSTVNPNGASTFKMTNADITVYYNAKTLHSTIHYVDVTGLTANSDGSYTGGSTITGYGNVDRSGKIGTSFTVDTPTIKGYNYISTFGSNVFTDPEHDVYVYYTKKTLGFNVYYVLSSNHSYNVAPSVPKSGLFGDAYTVDEPQYIGGYEYVSNYDPNSGHFDDPSGDVYVYYTERDTSVVVKYQEEGTGTQLKDDVLLSGKFNDVKTVDTSDVTGADGYLYRYHSIDNPYNFGSTSVTLKMDMDDPIIVYMTKVPVSITVHFLEYDTTSPPLISDGTLSGYVGESYATGLLAYQGTLIPGFIYYSTSGDNIDKKFTEGHGAINIFYSRVRTTIYVEHYYTNGECISDTDQRNGLFEASTDITPIADADLDAGCTFLNYTVTTAGTGKTAFDGDEIHAKFAASNYTVRLYYGPAEGTITVHYRDADGADSDPDLATPDVYHGDYAHDIVDVDDLGNEIITHVPADTFSLGDISAPSVTGYDLTGDVTLDDSDFTSTDFSEDGQDIIVWYEREEVSLPVQYVDEAGNDLLPDDDTTITGLFGDSYLGDAEDAQQDIYGYVYNRIRTPYFNDGYYPSIAGTDNPEAVVYLVYLQLRAALNIEYRDFDTNEKIPGVADGSVSGYVNTTYTLPDYPPITGYDPHSIEDPNNGKIPEQADAGTIIYYYTKKDVSVNVEYVENNGGTYVPMNNGDDDYTINGKFDDPYTVDVKSYTGFSAGVVVDPNNGSTLTEDMETIQVVFSRNRYSATLRFVEVDGAGDYVMDGSDYTDVADSTTITGLYGSSYSSHMPASLPVVPGYTQTGAIDYPGSGDFTTAESQVILVPYLRNTINMMLYFRDIDTNLEVKSSHPFSGPFGKDYQWLANDSIFIISHYNLVSPQAVEGILFSGSYTNDGGSITAWYQALTYNIPIYYKYTGNGNVLGTGGVSGHYGDSYTIPIESFTGYKYKSTDDPFGGVMTDDTKQQYITVWYTKKSGGGGGGETTEPEEPTPGNPPVIEPEEPTVEVPEEEVPEAPVPNTGGTETYLIPLLGLALIIAGGAKLIKNKR